MKPPSNAKIINAIAFFLSNSVMSLSLEFKNLNVRINVECNMGFTTRLIHRTAISVISLPPAHSPMDSTVIERGALR